MSVFIFKAVAEELSRVRPDRGISIMVDIKAIEAGLEPSLDTLSRSPLITQWQVLIGAGWGCLTGTVWGHPKIRNGPVVTSPICAIDRASFAWARTASRFYRLEEPAAFDDPALAEIALQLLFKENT